MIGMFKSIYCMQDTFARALYTRYPIVARALGLAAFRPSASREQRYLAYKLARRIRPKGRPSAVRDDRVYCIQIYLPNEKRVACTLNHAAKMLT